MVKNLEGGHPFQPPEYIAVLVSQNIEPRRNVLDVQMKIGKSKKYVKKMAVFFAASHICPSFSRSI